MHEVQVGTSKTLRLGSFVSTDGSAATALTIAQADVKLSINGAALAAKHASGGGTHDANGFYSIDFDATDFATAGVIDISINVTDAMPFFDRIKVKHADAYAFSFSTGWTALVTAIWDAGSRTLTSFGTLVADIVTAIQAYLNECTTAYDLTVTVAYADATPIPGALVRVINGATVITQGTTDSNGEAVIGVDDGEYTVRVSKAMNSFEDTSVTISGANESISVEGTSLYPAAPAPGLQTLSGYVLKANGTAASSAIVTAAAYEIPEIVDDNLITHVRASATCDSNGFFSIDLIKGAKIILRAVDGKEVLFGDRVTVTDEDTAKLSDYIPAA